MERFRRVSQKFFNRSCYLKEANGGERETKFVTSDGPFFKWDVGRKERGWYRRKIEIRIKVSRTRTQSTYRGATILGVVL